MAFHSVIIGGSSRSGKTWLANNLDVTQLNGLNLDFELLLNVYYFYLWPKAKFKREKILLEYINRPRAINPEKTKFSSPANYLTKKQIENITSISAEFDNILSSINNILDYICLINKKKFWVGADYNAEHLYSKYKYYIPKLKLITCIRNPKEVICASLYWRTYPDKINNINKEIRKRIFLWKSSFIFFKKPSLDILVLNMNKLTSNNFLEIEKLNRFLASNQSATFQSINIKNNFKFWFYEKCEKFFSPLGSFENLLTKKHLSIIDKETKLLWLNFINNNTNSFFFLEVFSIRLYLYLFYQLRFLKINFNIYLKFKKLFKYL